MALPLTLRQAPQVYWRRELPATARFTHGPERHPQAKLRAATELGYPKKIPCSFAVSGPFGRRQRKINSRARQIVVQI